MIDVEKTKQNMVAGAWYSQESRTLRMETWLGIMAPGSGGVQKAALPYLACWHLRFVKSSLHCLP